MKKIFRWFKSVFFRFITWVNSENVSAIGLIVRFFMFFPLIPLIFIYCFLAMVFDDAF